ncbi:MAG TPA: hypothetical protein VE863_15625, partial [Pyrinomonadaceae bacterium]|nr:hypothetical protein [Pyrinomonadaceae bacterium]
MTKNTGSDQLAISLWPTAPIYTDQGTHASLNVAIYQPVSGIPTGWYWFGSLAVQLPGGSWSFNDPVVATCAPWAVIVNPISPDAICAVTPGTQPLYTDQGSHGNQNLEIWQPAPSLPGYNVVGLFARVVSQYGGPPPDLGLESEGFCAIKGDLLSSGQAGSLIWSD